MFVYSLPTNNLVEHFSSIALGNTEAQTDILGQSYEYLIKKFADLTNRRQGNFIRAPGCTAHGEYARP
jgi:type I restriction-modification system DNA methylase subunit